MSRPTKAQKNWHIVYHVKATKVSSRKKIRKPNNLPPTKDSPALLDTYEEVQQFFNQLEKKYHAKNNH